MGSAVHRAADRSDGLLFHQNRALCQSGIIEHGKAS